MKKGTNIAYLFEKIEKVDNLLFSDKPKKMPDQKRILKMLKFIERNIKENELRLKELKMLIKERKGFLN